MKRKTVRRCFVPVLMAAMSAFGVTAYGAEAADGEAVELTVFAAASMT